MERTHWKKQFNYDYLGSYSLPDGKDVVLTIRSTRKEVVTGPNNRKEECFVCEFEEQGSAEWVKPMILNRTNCKTISKLYGTPYIEEWSGRKVQIGIEQVNAFGETTDALRIRNIRPDVSRRPQLVPGTPQWQQAVDYLRNGSGSIEAVQKKYDLSDSHREQLLNDAL